MEAFGKNNYKKLEKYLKAGKYATQIADQALPDRRWHHVYCGQSWESPESGRVKPLILVARPGRYSMTVSATNGKICITVPIQSTNSSSSNPSRTSSSDKEKIRKIRTSILEAVLGDRMGFTLGGDGPKFGLVALARPGAYICQRIGDKELKIYMALEDDENPMGAPYVSRAPTAAPRSVGGSSYETSYYSGSSYSRSSSSGGSSTSPGSSGRGYWRGYGRGAF